MSTTSGPISSGDNVEPDIANLPIISLTDLQSMYEAKVGGEAADKRELETFFQFTESEIVSSLKQWALTGFIDGYVIRKAMINTNDRNCIDGQVRDIQQYVTYLTGKIIKTEIEQLAERLPGIRVALMYVFDSLQLQVWTN